MNATKLRVLEALSEDYLPNDNEGDGDVESNFLVGLESQQKELMSILEKGLVKKANGMGLLCGPRGHGKRTLLKYCLRKLRKDHPTKSFRIIKLNGLLLDNGSDTFAMREIAAQLTTLNDTTNPYLSAASSKEIISEGYWSDNELGVIDMYELDGDGEEDQKRNSVEDTDKVTLQDGHNIERRSNIQEVQVYEAEKRDKEAKKRKIQEETSPSSRARGRFENLVENEENRRKRNVSFHLNIGLVTDAMRRAKVDGIPLFFILEDLEVFADRKNFRQLLLYHLMDKIASHDTLLVLLGITSRQTIAQMLEKRLRSRFSTVTLHFSRYTFDALKSILIGKFLSKGRNIYATNLAKIFEDKESPVHKLLKRSLMLDRDIRWFTGVLSMSLLMLDSDSKQSMERSIFESLLSFGVDVTAGLSSTEIEELHEEHLTGDKRILAIKNLSRLQLAVLISAKRLMMRDSQKVKDRDEITPLTFTKIKLEYDSFVTRESFGTDIFPCELFFKGFCQLIDDEVFVIRSDHTGNGFFQHRYISTKNRSQKSFRDVPVYLCHEFELELHVALAARQLKCSTSLRNWGLKSD